MLETVRLVGEVMVGIGLGLCLLAAATFSAFWLYVVVRSALDARRGRRD